MTHSQFNLWTKFGSYALMIVDIDDEVIFPNSSGFNLSVVSFSGLGLWSIISSASGKSTQYGTYSSPLTSLKRGVTIDCETASLGTPVTFSYTFNVYVPGGWPERSNLKLLLGGIGHL